MQLVGLIAMLADKFYVPEGGMGRITEVLAAEFSRLGGESHPNASVERIVVERGRATGVVVGGSRIAADAVVSTTRRPTTIHRSAVSRRCAHWPLPTPKLVSRT